jgi:leader peptidase (prepilin peptidase) / N-methyltransferase
VTAIVVAGCALLGLVVAGFLNVVIDRVPDRAPLRGERDGEASAPVSLGGLPSQPWLGRRGRGGAAGSLPRRWLGVELLTATCFALAGWRFGAGWELAPVLVLTAALVAVSVVDLQLLRIPDRITFPALAASVPLIVAASLARDVPDAMRGALVGMVGYFVLLLVPHLVYPKGMGFGDVKLALLMGLHLGWLGWSAAAPVAGPVRIVLWALVLGSALGAVFGGLVALATKRNGAFPFGPALAAACFALVLASPALRI